MKKFISRIIIYALLVASIHLITGALFAGGKTDPFYLRFTSNRQKSLIIGTSRAALALQPRYINHILKESDWDLPIYNFSFTVSESPFGPLYLRAIKKKIDSKVKNGIFIISVDPWAISRKRENVDDQPEMFQEKERSVGNMVCVNIPVNYEYLIRNYDKPWGKIILSVFEHKTWTLRSDGWFDVNEPMDRVSIARRTEKKVRRYKNDSFYIHRTYSKTRHFYLNETIKMLKNHGDVFLVRLPVAEQMLALDNQLIADFDEMMMETANQHHTPYFNFTNESDRFQTIDGVHLEKKSGAIISMVISAKIRNWKNRKNIR